MKSVDDVFWDWVESSIPDGPPRLCPGARVTVDAHGSTLTFDESLPDGVWIVTDANGKTRRLEGVTGPMREVVEP